MRKWITMHRRAVALSSVVLTVLLCSLAVFVAQSAGARQAVPLPPVGAGFDSQLGGDFAPAKGVRVVERDWHAQPAAGLYSICYVDVFETQAEAASFWLKGHPALVLHRAGVPVEDANWPGQYLVDSSTAAKRAALARIDRAWVATCGRKKFQAVEFDNLDSYTRSDGLLSADDNLALAHVLARQAHRLSMAVVQKNDPSLGEHGRAAGFDFAIAESCQVYKECGTYERTYGREVYEIEYTDEPRSVFTAACAARGGRISIVLRDRLLTPPGSSTYYDERC